MDEIEFSSADGTPLVAHRLGGGPLPALFVHGTGFNGLSLRPVALVLSGEFDCVAVDLAGHGQSGPRSTYSLDGFVDDVVATSEALDFSQAVGIGHSLGATALLVAAARRPELFSFLYCYEPIIFSPEMPRRPPTGLAELTRRRRARFESAEAALERFQSRPPFSSFDRDSLAGYLEGGLLEDDGSVVLACRPDDEAAIYDAVPTFDVLPKLESVVCPVTVAFGDKGDTLPAESAAVVASRLRLGRAVALEGLDHFGPLVDPGAVARSIVRARETAGA